MRQKKILLLLFFSGIFPLCAQTWNKVGNANYSNPVYSLRNINNELYVGGDYSLSPKINIAKWNGVIWTPIDSAAFGDALCFLDYNSELYLGGGFSQIEGTVSCGIAKWNGTNWMSLGNGISPCTGYINDIEVLNGDVYAGGYFTKIGSVNTYGIGKWDGTAWSSVAGGLSGGSVLPIGNALLYYKNELYVGGDFSIAGNVPCNSIARWDGTKWDSINEGTSGEVLALLDDTVNNFLYAGGRMYKGNARWDGYSWTTLDSGIWGNVYSLAIYHNQLYAVGYFQTTKDTLWGFARWNGTFWESVGGVGTDWGTTVYSAQVYKDELYIGGGFTKIGNDTSIKWIARWYSPPDTTCKFLLNPVIETMLSLTPPNGVSDTFYYTDSVAVQFYNNIASASAWQWDFGDGKNGSGKTPIHYYNTAGTYTVSVIVNYPYGPKGPCIDTAHKIITIIFGVGVNEIQVQNFKFKVFPNPAKAEINISVEGEENKNYVAIIYNSVGAKVTEQKFSKQTKISTSAFSKGIYQVQVCDKDGKSCHTEKVVIE